MPWKVGHASISFERAPPQYGGNADGAQPDILRRLARDAVRSLPPRCAAFTILVLRAMQHWELMSKMEAMSSQPLEMVR